MISRKLQLVTFSSLLWLLVGLAAFASQLDQMAVHEAGHAVATLALGGQLDDIHILPGEGGVTYCGHPRAKEDVIIDLAGYAAQRVLLQTDDQYGATSDFQNAADRFGSHFMKLLPEAERIVARHQDAIRRIAIELKQTRDMSGSRARELFSQASVNEDVALTTQPPQEQKPETTRDQEQSEACQVVGQTLTCDTTAAMTEREQMRDLYIALGGMVCGLLTLAAVAKLNGH